MTTRSRTLPVALVAMLALAWARFGSLPAGLLDLDRSTSTVVLDRHGEVLYETRGADGSRSARLVPRTD